jgi:hypothetical protein
VAGITTCLVLGLAALGALEWATSGGFAHHLFASNVSRVFLSQLSAIPVLIASHSIYVGLGVLTIAGSVASLRKLMRLGGGLAALRERVAADRGTAMSMILLVYFGLATPMLFAIAKSGANLNYLIEWTNIVAIFAALSLTSVAKAVHVQGTGSASSQASLLPAFTVAALVVQSLTLPTDRFDLTVKLPSEFESRELSRMVRTATKPIISDDMVMLVRNGKEIYIEPAIIGEGGSLGVFDQRPIIRDTLAGKFAFFITFSRRGDPTFDARYTAIMADAIDKAYPRKLELAGRTVHLPAR